MELHYAGPPGEPWVGIRVGSCHVSLQSQAGNDKEAMEEEYQKALEVIFAYGFGCCVFKHNICGDHPKVPKGMLDSANLLPP